MLTLSGGFSLFDGLGEDELNAAGAMHELHGWSGCYLDDVSVLGLLAPLQRHFGIPKLCFQKHRKRIKN